MRLRARVSGLTPSAKALFVAAAAHAQPHGVVLYVVPSDGDLEQTVRRRLASSSRRSKGLSPAAAERAVLPFPSHEVDPYRGLAPHIGVTSVRARALLRHRAAARRASWSRRRPRCCRASARPSGCSARRSTLKPGQDIAPTDLAELLVDAGFTPRGSGRRARRVRHPRRHRRHLSRRRGAAGAARVHRRHDRDAAHLRSVDAALDRADRSGRDRAAARRAPATIAARRIVDDWRAIDRRRSLDVTVSIRAAARRDHRLRADEVDGARAKLLEQLQHSYDEAREAVDERHAAARRARSPTGTPSPRARPGDRSCRSSASTTTRALDTRRQRLGEPAASHIRCQPAVEMQRPRRRLGRRDPAAARRRRDDAVRRGDAGPRRAHDRAAQGIRRLRRSGRARRRRALRRGARRDRRAVARLPPARRRPADLRRGRRLRGGAPRAGAAPLRDQGVSLRSARSQGRRLRRPRRPRHRHVRRPEADWRRRQRCRSSSSCATPARTSCSCRSSGSIWSRNTPARRSRRSIAWAARRGSAPRRKVKKAMRDMAEELLKLYAARKAVPGPRLQRRTRTGSRNSRTRSSTT